jgi:ATP synthase protein I
MKGFVSDLKKIGVLRVVQVQVLLTAISGAATYYINGSRPMFAAVYGGLIVIISSWWLAHRLRQASDMLQGKEGSKTTGTLVLFAGLGQRLLFMGAAFAYGIGYLGLPPLPMIVTFALASAGNIFIGRT